MFSKLRRETTIYAISTKSVLRVVKNLNPAPPGVLLTTIIGTYIINTLADVHAGQIFSNLFRNRLCQKHTIRKPRIIIKFKNTIFLLLSSLFVCNNCMYILFTHNARLFPRPFFSLTRVKQRRRAKLDDHSCFHMLSRCFFFLQQNNNCFESYLRFFVFYQLLASAFKFNFFS